MAICPRCDAWMDDRDLGPGEMVVCWACKREIVPVPADRAPPPRPGPIRQPGHPEPRAWEDGSTFNRAFSQAFGLGCGIFAAIIVGLVALAALGILLSGRLSGP